MAGENAERVRRLYDAWNDDDFGAAAAAIHPDVEWRPSGTFPRFRSLYRGREGVHEFWVTMKEAWDHFTIHIEQLVEDGDVVVTDVRFDAAGKVSGVRVDLAFAHVWELEDGLIARYSSHPTFDEAVAAAGVSGRARQM